MRSAVRYATVGGVAGLIYLAIALLGESLGLPEQSASALGLSAAAATAYIGHHKITFAAHANHRSYLPRFLAVVLTGYCVSFVLLKLLAESDIVSYRVAILAIAGTNMVASYLANRMLVFHGAG
jgi:putative flippase GtrA